MKKYLPLGFVLSGLLVFAGTASVAHANQAPVGYFDNVINGVAQGWTVDPDVPGTPISVDLYVDGSYPTGKYLGRITANTPRPDITSIYPTYTGNHGFTYTIPAQYQDGKQHALYAYGVDSTGGANTLLIGSPKTFTILNNLAPVGYFDSIVSDVAAGWAVDPDVPTTSISVDIYIDGPNALTGTMLGRVTANVPRPGVTTAYPAYTGNHGFTFTIPSKYSDNKPHTVYAYGIDSAGGANTLLTGSPITFTIAPTPSNPFLGVTWTEATDGASFSGRLGHTSVVFNNKMWVIGGYNGNEDYLNDVWSSSDGVNWVQVTKAAAFSPRRSQTSLVFNNKMWVIGGLDSNGNALNDVWSSSDGVNWVEATKATAFSPRRGQTSVVFNNEMWVIGGYDGTNNLNDVWSSSDGVTWTEASKAAAFSPRRGQTSVVFNGLMWVMGGYDGTNYFNDVWSSSDGVTWTQVTKAAAFPARELQTSVVDNNLIWVIGGLNSAGSELNDVWSSSDGMTWTEASKAAAFPARDFHTSLVYNNLIWAIGGLDISSVPLNDVWFSSPTSITPPTPPQPVLITFQNQPNNITTDLSSYPVFVYDSQAATVTVNGQQMSISDNSGQDGYFLPPLPRVYYGGQLNVPLKPGVNSLVVTASSSAGTLLWSVTKTITLDPNYSLAGRELLYASIPDLANSAVTDTVVIDPKADIVLGYLPSEQVTAADPQGQFVVEYDGTANHIFSAATGVEGPALPFTAGAGSPQYPLMTADGYAYWGTQKVQLSNNSLLPVTLPKSVDSRRCSLLSGGLVGSDDFSKEYVMNDSGIINTYPTAVASANHGYAAITPDGDYALETSYASAKGAIQSFRLKDGADAESPASDYLEEIALSADGTQAIIGSYGNSSFGGGGIYVVGATTGGLLLPHGNTGPVVTQFGASSVALDSDKTVYASSRFLQAIGGTIPQWGTPDNRGVAAFTFGSDGYLHLTAKYFLASQHDYASGHRIVVKPAAK